jgi:hypothetical protein
MLVARHWAEHRIRHRTGRGPQVTIRRWGWSDASPDAAAAHARTRAEAALAEHLTGRSTDRRERPPGYDGADGLPIREEILGEHPDCGAVITRMATTVVTPDHMPGVSGQTVLSAALRTGDSSKLDKRQCSHNSSCSARVGDPLGAARLGDPLGATGLENGEA